MIGENGFHYRVSGENWGQLPEGCVYREGTAVAVDSKDQVYVFNRGTIPMIVFETHGKLLRTWGNGVFANPQGVTIAPDDAVFCVDNGDSPVRQRDLSGDEGRVNPVADRVPKSSRRVSEGSWCVVDHRLHRPLNRAPTHQFNTRPENAIEILPLGNNARQVRARGKMSGSLREKRRRHDNCSPLLQVR